LYGRDQQLDLLMESFRSVQLSGNSEVCIVNGYSGVGKTSLVSSALDKMMQEGALTAYAKFDQFNEDVPYTAMVNRLSCLSDIRFNVFAISPNSCSSKVQKISIISRTPFH
jgi:predicted ATPase